MLDRPLSYNLVQVKPIWVEWVIADLLEDFIYRYLVFAITVFMVVFNLFINELGSWR